VRGSLRVGLELEPLRRRGRRHRRSGASRPRVARRE
jgi:hypothetical protein